MKLFVLSLVAIAALACLDPKDRRPGLRLSGEVVTDPVEDWSFTDAHREIFVETRPPWLVPHSVTIVCAAIDSHLYVGALSPTEKRWVANVARDPNVRLAIGGKVYEERLERVEDAAEQETVYRGFASKYGREIEPPAERPVRWYWRVLPRS
jgi:hypothetical protein